MSHRLAALVLAGIALSGCDTARQESAVAIDAGRVRPVEAPAASPLRARARARVTGVLDAYEADRAAWLAAADESEFHVNDTFGKLPEDLKHVVDRKIEKKLKAGTYSGAADAAAYFMDQRVPEGEEYPIERVRAIAEAEYEQANRIAAARAQRGGVVGRGASLGFGVSDELLGSDPIIDGWQALGPGNIGGRTRTLVISPNGPGTGGMDDEGFMLAAGVAGGVFKSTDGGESWRPTSDLLDNIAVCTLALDPTDPTIVYAGTGEGYSNGDAVRGLGIFKSEDAGETWRQLPETVQPIVTPISFHYVNKIVVSPTDPLRIYAAARTGVWIHRNAGEPENAEGDMFQWELVLGNPFYLLGAFNSEGSSVGATDLKVRPAPVSGEPGDVEEEFILAAFGSFIDDGLYASPDGGDSWFRIVDESASENDPFKIDSAAQGRMAIDFGRRVNASDPGVVYVLMARNQRVLANDPDTPDPDITAANNIPFAAAFDLFAADLNDLEIERNDQDNIVGLSLPFERRLNRTSGTNLLNRMLLSNALANNICGTTPNLRINQGWYDNIIKVDPSNSNVVWAGGVDLFRSDDGGRNFGLASYWYFDIDEESYVHADQHEIVFHPDYNGGSNTTMYVTNDGGIFRTIDALAPTVTNGCPFDLVDGVPVESEMVFESLNNGYAVTQFYHGQAGDSIIGGRDLYVGGTQDNGTIRTLQRRCTEDWTELLGGDGGYVAVDPTDNDLIYAETQNFGNIYRVQNSPGFGEGPRNISDRLRGRDSGLFITPIAMDPSNPGTIWTGGNRPWRTTNADSSVTELITWTPGPNLNLPGVPPIFDVIGQISAIAVAPTDPRIVYVGTEDGWVARTGNATSNSPDFQILSQGLPIESGYISSIAVDPDDANVIWVTNARFTEVSPNDPNPDANLYRGECSSDCNNPDAWIFTPMDGTDCDLDDEIVPVLPDVPAHWVAIRRCDSGSCSTGNCLVFVGTEIGVYVSDDAYDIDNLCDPDGPDGPTEPADRVTWQLLNIGDDPSVGVMPTTVVESLDFRDDNTIVAFTHGRGAFLANILRECNNVPIGKPCSPADIAAPYGQIGLEDLNAWLQDTAQGRLSADMPVGDDECGDGLLDLFDINRFVELYSAGCSGE